MATGERARFLGRPIPAGFEVRRLSLSAGTECATSPAEWDGALVLVEAGRIEVVCTDGARCAYDAGALLALAWLAIARLVNAGPDDVRLLAVTRRAPIGSSPVPAPGGTEP